MSKFAKGISWREYRLADALEVDGAAYTVDLVARKGTGVQGFRVSVVYIPHEGADMIQRDLPNAPTTADVHRLVRDLSADTARLASMIGEAAPETL